MVLKYHLSTVDYVVICFSLLVSSVIGIAAKFCDGYQKTANEYLLAGKNMSRLPVLFSIVVTLTSTASFIGSPAESYKYGLKPIIACLTFPLGMILASSVFLPVYYKCEVSTVNEYLQLRFGKIIRHVIAGFFLLQMILYMSTCLYGAVLSFSAVTDISLVMSTLVLGSVCTLYCAVGGLKGVIWSDVFQAILMLICMLSIYIVGIRESGSVLKIYQIAKEGQRLDIFDFQFDFTKRYCVWGSLISGIVTGCSLYGTNQVQVQRILSLSNVKRAKSVLRMSSLPVNTLALLCYILGVVLYSIFNHCDPVLNKDHTGLSSYDQMVPYFIVKYFSSIPGMTGLCMAGIFSASLSSISSILNSISTVTVVDFIKPLFHKYDISDSKTVWIAKLLTIIYGVICISLTFCFLKASSVTQLVSVVLSLLDGPMLAVFTVGVLTRKGSDKSISIAFVISYVTMACLVFGALSSNYNESPLPVSAGMCKLQRSNSSSYGMSASINNEEYNATLSYAPAQIDRNKTFILFKISFIWYGSIGFFITLVFIFITVLVTGFNEDVIPADSKCLSPIARLWMKNLR